MDDLALWDAWQLWGSGHELTGKHLYGWPIRYWGRLGKALAFAGGVTILLDIAGADRLQQWGGWLLGHITPRLAAPQTRC